MDSLGLEDEDFQGTAAQFDVDYLEHISSDTLETNLTRQSLYVKFDPLVEAQSMRQNLPESGEDCHSIGPLFTTTECDVTLPTVTSGQELKYSEDEATAILKSLIEEESKKEREKYTEELDALQRELVDAQEAVTQLKSGKGIKGTIKQTHKQDMNQLEQQYQKWETLGAKHERLEALIIDRHEERKRKMMSHQDDVLSAESGLSSLERSLEDLIQRYASLKDHSSNLEKYQSELRQKIEELELMSREVGEEYVKLKQERVSLVDKGNLAHEALQKELASKLAIERVSTKKLELRLVTLTTEQQNKVRDKEQLSKICDELLQELNKTS